MALAEIKHFEVQLTVDGYGNTNTFIALESPFVNDDGFIEIRLSDGVQMFDRARTSQITIKPITE